jgi:hypothetical protein
MLLRAGGVVVAIFGVLVLAVDHSLAGIILLAIGVLLWLGGHWHYALGPHEYKSPLAQRIFQQLLPHRLDPTRGWGWPVTIATRASAIVRPGTRGRPRPN